MQRASLILSLLVFPAVTSFARASHSSSADDFAKILPIGVVVLVAIAFAAINASRKPKPISQEQVAQLQAEATEFFN
jgi:hypothetical protein